MLFLEQRDLKVQKTNAFGTSLVLFLVPTSKVRHLQDNLLHLAISSFLFVLIPARTELISAVVGKVCGYRAWKLFYTTSPLPGQEFSAIKKACRVRMSFKGTILPLYKSEKHMHKFQFPSSPEDDTRIREITENGNKEDHRYQMATIHSIKPGG